MTHKREGKKLGHHFWPNGEVPKRSGRTGGFSLTILEMEEVEAIKASLQVAAETLVKISALGERHGFTRCNCNKCYACLAYNTVNQLKRIGVVKI